MVPLLIFLLGFVLIFSPKSGTVGPWDDSIHTQDRPSFQQENTFMDGEVCVFHRASSPVKNTV